jgi:hypothetical protein
MDPDVELVALIGGVHLIGLVFAMALVWHFMRTDPADSWPHPEDDGGGGGGNIRPEPPVPVRPRGGGIPLPDAIPARVRLREPGRLADLRPSRERRPSREPVRRPHRVG